MKSGEGRRFFDGHPWVFSNELQAVPKIPPGEWAELFDASGKSVAVGFGNPHSLIAFRTVSRRSDFADLIPGILNRALTLRFGVKAPRESFRWIFGEADQVPGLIIDVYFSHLDVRKATWVLVFQPQSAGADHVLHDIISTAKRIFEGRISTAVSSAASREEPEIVGVIRRDGKGRTLEGLTLTELPELAWPVADKTIISSLHRAEIFMEDLGWFSANLWTGQKTGFFLDQRENLHRARAWLERRHQQSRNPGSKKFRILDLFSFSGQWGASLGSKMLELGADVEVVFADASQEALDRALENAKSRGLKNAKAIKADLVENFESAFQNEAPFDWVCCDPPALIQSKKYFPQGARAYLKVNRDSLKLLKPDGVFISSSCSHALSEADFENMISKAALKAGGLLQWVARGGHAWDHPELPGFPEGTYLKWRMGVWDPIQ